MKPYIMNLITALVLISLTTWAYFTSENPSFTALIPSFFGIVFLALTIPFKRENKVAAHIIVLLTFLLIFALIKPLTAAFGRADDLAIARVVIMMGTCVIAMGVYIKSFIDARKK